MTQVGGHQHDIRRNQIVSRVLIVSNLVLLGVTGAVLMLAFNLGPAAALVAAGVFVLGGLLVSLVASAGIGLVAGAHQAGTRAPQAERLLQGVSLAAGIPTPQLFIVDDPDPNAFAYGRSPRNSRVAVTTGLLARLPPREVEAVLAHEVSHIANYDTRVMTVAFGTYGMFLLVLLTLVGLGTWANNATEDDSDNWVILGVGVIASVALLIALPAALGSWVLTMAISRDREALADATAVKLLSTPVPLRRALETLATCPEHSRPTPIAALCIRNPGKHSSLGSTHPPLAWRIAVLRQLEGLGPDPSPTNSSDHRRTQ